MNKAGLRRHFLALQRGLSPAQARANSEAIARQFSGWLSPEGITCVHCFLPIVRNNEPDTGLIMKWIRTALPQVQVVVPRTDELLPEMESYVLTEHTPLFTNALGITEPLEGTPVPPERIDLLILPLLAFDGQGHRVGYGRGYYDRYLARCRPDALRVGVCHHPPIPLVPDTHPFDIHMNACFTPEGSYEL